MPLIPPGKSPIPIPIQEKIGEFFTDLLGKGTAASKGTAVAIEADGEPVVVATYQDDLGRLTAVLAAELLFAAGCGASLAMVPAMALDEVKKTQELPEFLRDNYYEVANIFSSVLNGTNSPHVKIKEMYVYPAEELPEDVQALVARPGARRDYDVTIEGYGGGRLSLLARPS